MRIFLALLIGALCGAWTLCLIVYAKNEVCIEAKAKDYHLTQCGSK